MRCRVFPCPGDTSCTRNGARRSRSAPAGPHCARNRLRCHSWILTMSGIYGCNAVGHQRERLRGALPARVMNGGSNSPRNDTALGARWRHAEGFLFPDGRLPRPLIPAVAQNHRGSQVVRKRANRLSAFRTIREPTCLPGLCSSHALAWRYGAGCRSLTIVVLFLEGRADRRLPDRLCGVLPFEWTEN